MFSGIGVRKVNWTLLRVLAVVIFICMLMAIMSATDVSAATSETQPTPIAASESLELALVCIVLGGCLVFLFRPKRYQSSQ